MFTALVASDIFGEKMNLEIGFPSRPSLAELKEETERCYNGEVGARASRVSAGVPAGTPAVPPYCVKRFQLFDEVSQRWASLASSNQLTDYCQLYAFQPPNPWHKEVRAPIPAPIKTKAHLLPLNPTHIESVARSRLLAGDPPPIDPLGASHEEKTNSVFDELDVNNDRGIDGEEWAKGVALLRLEAQFDGATVRDLHVKADANGDGKISFSEWQRFTELYPTLLDSLYQRCQAYWEDKRFEQHLQEGRDRLGDMHAHMARLEAQHRDNANIVASREAALTSQEGKVRDRTDTLRSREDAARDAGKDTERAQKLASSADADLALQREKERLKSRGLDEANSEVSAAKDRVALASNHASDCDTRQRALEGQHADVKSALDRETVRTQTALHDLQVSQGALREAAAQRQQAGEEHTAAADGLVQAEGLASTGEANVRDADQACNLAGQNVVRNRVVRDEEDRALQSQRGREQAANQARIAQEKLTEELAQRLRGLEAEHAALHEQMAEVCAREQPLITEEIRLRGQRDALEEKETVLRHDHRSFYSATFSGQSPARSLSTSIRRK